MSSEKISTSIHLNRSLVLRLDEEAKKESRSRSYIVERILLRNYSLPGEGEEEKGHAHKT